jgi:hypothetical protein
MPVSDSWLLHMTMPFDAGASIVAGYSGFYPEPTLLNKFSSWETAHTYLLFSSFASIGRPYMAVGRNMACTLQAFEKAQAFPAWTLLPSGDDDLLVHAAGHGNHVHIVSHPGSFTMSQAMPTWERWLRQKQRHSSTGKFYRPTTRLLLGLYGLSHGLFWTFLFLSLAGPYWVCALGIFSIRGAICYSLWRRVFRHLEVPLPLHLIVVFDWGWSAYNFVLAPYILWKNKKQWN